MHLVVNNYPTKLRLKVKLFFFGLIKMVWLVQNCRSNKCLIPQTPRASVPYKGSVRHPLRSPDPSHTHVPLNHKSWIRPWVLLEYCYTNGTFTMGKLKLSLSSFNCKSNKTIVLGW